ncbi:MAG TPA: hypothetical protein VF532_14745 [Candidatus Angelobacter sp.]
MKASRHTWKKWKAVACLLGALLLSAAGNGQDAVMTGTVELALDHAYQAMYNLNFDLAFREADTAKAADREDPMPWVAQACALLFREFERLHILRSELFSSDDKFDGRAAHAWDPPSRQEFENALAQGERRAQAWLAHNPGDVRALFALTLINGLRADDAALIGKKNMSALSFIKSANAYAERLLARAPDYYDAYLATGMGKYIIGGKAAPVRWVLRLGGIKGDQEEGVRELKLAAEHGHFLAPFARILLAFDDLRHKNKAAARSKLAALHQQFPNNTLFVEELAKLDHAVGPAVQ